MAHVQTMPKLSDTMEKGHLLRWLVKEGDEVRPGTPVAEVETDKATMEAEAYHSGTVLKLLVPEATDVAPGTPLLVIGRAGEAIPVARAEAVAREHAPPRKASPAPAARAGGPEAPLAEAEAPAGRAGAAAPETARPPGSAPEPGAPVPGRRVVASPLARTLARQAGVDLGAVSGSGPGGRIVKEDIDAAVARAQSASPPPAAAPVEGERVPLTSMRRIIAERLTASKAEAPHYYLQAVLDMDAAAALRRQVAEALASRAIKVSYNDLVLKASALALKEVPEVNASWRGDHVFRHARVHIGVAVALDDGLVTPVLRDADRMSLSEIAAQVRELSGRARERRLKPDEYQGSTFTVSNLGMMGIERFTAVIQPGEAAILAVGAVTEQPVARGGQLHLGLRMVVSLSCDHRLVDGATGARWLSAFRGYLENPLRMVAV